MQWYRADLHIHSVLSPCGDLGMSPSKVAAAALKQNIDIIAITDHNSALNLATYKTVLEKAGIVLIPGIEIQTSEEIHLIALFDCIDSALAFGEKLYDSLLPLENDPDFFGDQVVIDAFENIIKFESRALINSSVWSFDETCKKLMDYDTIVYPAHVNATAFSVIGQLGFIPPDLNFSAVEITAKGNKKQILQQFPFLADYQIIRSSDSHYARDIGSGLTEFFLERPTFQEIKRAITQQDGRKLSS